MTNVEGKDKSFMIQPDGSPLFSSQSVPLQSEMGLATEQLSQQLLEYEKKVSIGGMIVTGGFVSNQIPIFSSFTVSV